MVPFWVIILDIRCRIIIGIQKGTIILTTTQIIIICNPGFKPFWIHHTSGLTHLGSPDFAQFWGTCGRPGPPQYVKDLPLGSRFWIHLTYCSGPALHSDSTVNTIGNQGLKFWSVALDAPGCFGGLLAWNKI